MNSHEFSYESFPVSFLSLLAASQLCNSLFLSLRVDDYEIILGDLDSLIKEANEQRLTIEQIVPHPSYKSGIWQNDVAILKLESEVKVALIFVRLYADYPRWFFTKNQLQRPSFPPMKRSH
jgi:hypothetical protein